MLRGLFALILIVGALALYLRFYGYDLAKNWLEGPAGPRVAGKELGKAIKVYGTFAPMKLDNWTINTASFTSDGWPGEAIGSLNVYNVRAEFDPGAIWRRAWRFSNIQVDSATIRLDKPDDALKLHPVKKPPPWYAIFMPDHFECGPIVSQHSDVKFAFQGTEAGITDAHVQADLIGKNLRYTATSGVLNFPYLQPLRIKLLKMYVTRPWIAIDTAQLVGLDDGDGATQLTLSGTIGMREDKSIDATVEMTDISIEKILPEDLRELIHGTVTGKIVWHRNKAGDDITSEGDLRMNGASIENLSVFKELSTLHDNPDLQNFTFEEASCHYLLDNGTLTLNLHTRANGIFSMNGTVIYNLKTKVADLDLAFDDLPLKTWMPPDFKPRYSGVAKATLKWHGQLATTKDSTATIGVNLDGTHITNPVLLRKFLEAKGFRAPDEINLDKANFVFTYKDEVFSLAQAELVAPGVLNARLSGAYAPSGSDLTATMDWQGLRLGTWLPPKLAEQFSGDLDGHLALAVRKWKFGNGSYGGDIHLLNGQLTYTSVQSLFARFFGDRQLLQLPLTRTDLSWTWDNGAATAKKIDIRGADGLGVQGNVVIDRDQTLSGTLWIGAKPEYLTWLPGAKDTVFNRHDDGLYWAKVNLSGTVKKPGQDLSSRVIAQLVKHPDAMASLGGKLISWYVGNWFGEAQKWQRPQVADVEVHGPTKADKQH